MDAGQYPVAPPQRLLTGSATTTGTTPSAVDLVVVGLGYVGLPLLRTAHRAGLSVAGYDLSETVIGGLNSGVSHIDDVSDDDVRALLAAGVDFTTGPEVLARADTVAICVPTPLDEDGRPDLTAVRAAAGTTAVHLSPGTLVVLESTTYPGTTEDVVRPRLEAGSALVAGSDFALAYSPERVDPGNRAYGIAETPRVVGGLTPACTARAETFYRRMVGSVVTARGIREAEMSKLLENTYRTVNIALVNELAILCHRLRVDVWDVIGCAATKPFGFQPFWPGPGIGGHCIPVDPGYLTHSARAAGMSLRLVEVARDINRDMSEYVVARTLDVLNARGLVLNGATVLLLGVTYKPDISDLRETPAEPIARRLRAMGAVVRFHDPYVPEWTVDGERLDCADLATELPKADITVLLQAHRAYTPVVLAAAQLLLDTRGVASRQEAVEAL